MRVSAAQTVVSGDIAESGRPIRDALRRSAEWGARLVSFCKGSLAELG